MARKREIINRTGEKGLTKEGYEIEIIEYFSYHNCTFRINDNRMTVLFKREYSELIRKSVTNPYHPSVHNVGYLGIGKYRASFQGKSTIISEIWRGILRRCYSEKNKEKFPSYIDCTVDERWHNFQVFAEWFENNYLEGFELDKDILVKGNKIYSPETCCFVPKIINTLFVKCDSRRGKYPIGVTKYRNKYITIFKTKHLAVSSTVEEAFETYKKAKEKYIKEVAEEWRRQIPEKVYNAMYNYKVEITD